MKRLLAIVLLLASMLLITACGGGGNNNTPGGGEDEGGTNLLSVTLLVSEGATVTSENPVKVEEGGSASFTLSLENKYVIREIEGASYNSETNTVTVENVTRDTRVSVTPVKVEYDTTVKYNYFYSGFKSGDTSSYRNGISLNAGSIITVKANNEGFAFMGWSLNNFLELGGKLVCAEREFTFELTPEMTDYGNCKIFANYADLRDNTVYYHLNGGTVDSFSSNLQTDRYQTVTVTPGSASVKVVMSANYYQKVGTVSLFWNDGSFYRDGYVLKEFNTKADGTGESFDPGSLYPMKSLGPNIYCIW